MVVLDLDAFAFRQFDDPNYQGTKFFDISKEQFILKVNEAISKNPCQLVDGYAPFCKHIFIPNFTNATTGAIELTHDIEPLIKSAYEARRPEELPVLTRWIVRSQLIDCNIQLKPAKYLGEVTIFSLSVRYLYDLILYSRDQIKKEAESMNTEPISIFATIPPTEYSIIAIKAQDCSEELPMAPITIMRNCFIEEGGSGVPLNRDAYFKSVKYWNNHCELR